MKYVYQIPSPIAQRPHEEGTPEHGGNSAEEPLSAEAPTAAKTESFFSKRTEPQIGHGVPSSIHRANKDFAILLAIKAGNYETAFRNSSHHAENGNPNPTNESQIYTLHALVVALFTGTASMQAGEFASKWHNALDRIWIGEDFWANPMED